MKGPNAQGKPMNFSGRKSASGGGERSRTSGGVSLRFQIDRLTLPGMSRADANRVVDAMRRELARLANSSPRRNWRGHSAISRLDGGTLRPHARPGEVGEHLAAQIFRGISK